MAESVFPKCPHCKEEVLIPLSAMEGTSGGPKVFAHWVCVKCGFYFGTGGTQAREIPKDITIAIIPEIAQKFNNRTSTPY